MIEKEENNPLKNDRPPSHRHEPLFDVTTNFSLLGWMLDKLGWKKPSEKVIDFTLEE